MDGQMDGITMEAYICSMETGFDIHQFGVRMKKLNAEQ